ncbi:histidine phosphatase family protein [Coprothermobacter platensis]|jgi:broad specificity phosphatase PhoE|uniref:histidine phosphatase family protein n=1 Tax=Coprothermobacter platensis TaxID=108819 RepID=UPI00036A1AF8|nr:histidine phosphatase family protein [Coprothermobacter platensis]
MRIYLVRHPETQWNKENRFQGQTDIPITEKGLHDLQTAAPILASLSVQTIYTSPLKRAKVVAQEVSKLTGKAFHEDRRIMEVNCGRWEGETVPHLMQAEPNLIEQWWKDPYNFQIPGGESYEDVERRTTSFLKEIVDKGEDALVVSHGIAILTMLRYVLQIPKNHVRSIRIDNLAIVRLDGDGNGLSLSMVNPARFLLTRTEITNIDD